MTNLTTKWTGEFWADFVERVGLSAIYGLIAYLTLSETDSMAGTLEQFISIVGIPTLLAALKVIAVNLKSERSSASLVGITSNKEV